MIARSDITICVPSSRRPTQAVHVKRGLLPSALVYVAENELDTYVAAGLPRACLRTHPNLVGLARIRNFIVRQCPTEVCVQVDDDFAYVQAMAGFRVRHIRDPRALAELVFSSALVASDMGVRLFAWSNKGTPLYYKDHDPMDLKGPVGRALGVIGKGVVWDERLVASVDTDVTLQELLESRIVFVDQRFYWHCGSIGGNPGGLQALRTSERLTLDRGLIQAKWGRFVEVEKKTKSGLTTNSIRVDRRQAWATRLEE